MEIFGLLDGKDRRKKKKKKKRHYKSLEALILGERKKREKKKKKKKKLVRGHEVTCRVPFLFNPKSLLSLSCKLTNES